MTEEPRCTCHVAVTTPEWVDPEDFPPMKFHVNHCPLHKAAPDLLIECEALLSIICDLPPMPGLEPKLAVACKRARMTIDKARGIGYAA